jgi:hypothetical protein
MRTTKHFGEGKGSFTLPLPPLALETPTKLVEWLNHSKKKDRDELRNLWDKVTSYLLDFVDLCGGLERGAHSHAHTSSTDVRI